MHISKMRSEVNQREAGTSFSIVTMQSTFKQMQGLIGSLMLELITTKCRVY